MSETVEETPSVEATEEVVEATEEVVEATEEVVEARTEEVVEDKSCRQMGNCTYL